MDAFLSGEDRVMLIRGAWGVGKTHFWSEYVKQKIESRAISQVAYSYVSLFGKTSLADIRASIFQVGKPIASDEALTEKFEKEYQESVGLLRNVPWLQDAKNKATNLARLSGWITNLARSTPFTEKYSRIISALEYRLVNGYLVCIDDIERKGFGLSIREIMGLIDELANQKKCKVVLVFNDKSFAEDRDKKEFEEYREKVVDIEVEYDPTHLQALVTAFSENNLNIDYLKEVTQILNIKNIRVLRKLKRVIETFEPPLRGVDGLILNEFLNHAAILVWSHYMRNESIPYEYITARLSENYWESFLMNEKEIPDDEKKYREIARKLDLAPSVYTNFIITYLAKGYIDVAEVQRSTKQLEIDVSRQHALAELNSIWGSYSDTFARNESEIKNRFLKFLDNHSDKINIAEFSSILDMLHTLGADVEPLMAKYFDIHGESLSSMNPNDITFARRAIFAPLHKKITELTAGRVNLTIDDVTSRLAANNGWNDGDTQYLASLSELQLRDWMLGDPENMTAKIRSGLLMFGKISGGSEEEQLRYKKIYANTVAVLRDIAKSSELNKMRISSIYGISIDD